MQEELKKALEALREGAPEIWAGLAAEHASANLFGAIFCLVMFPVFGVLAAFSIRKAMSKAVEEGVFALSMVGSVAGAVGSLVCFIQGTAHLYKVLQPNIALIELIR